MAHVLIMQETITQAGSIAGNPLLWFALVALGAAMIGGAMIAAMPRLGSFLRGAGSFGLVVVLVLTIIDIARLNPDLAMPQIGAPDQIIDGVETHIPLSRDGHYWIEAKVNGQPAHFLVDTGASLTALSPETAEAAGIEPLSVLGTVRLETANGSTEAQLTNIPELETGTIAAHDLRAVIAPTMNGVNVLGMNFLSRLKSWRVENGTLVLVPPDAE